jgi:DNA polymerase IIIc chi subunit
MSDEDQNMPEGDICQAVADLIGTLYTKSNVSFSMADEAQARAVEALIHRYYKAFFVAHQQARAPATAPAPTRIPIRRSAGRSRKG